MELETGYGVRKMGNEVLGAGKQERKTKYGVRGTGAGYGVQGTVCTDLEILTDTIFPPRLMLSICPATIIM